MRHGFMRSLAAFIACTCAGLGVSQTAHAQCGWQAGEGAPGVGGWVGPGGTAVSPLVLCSTMWDPDGAGPQPARLVVGGDFVMIGTVKTNCIAMWDGAHWVPFGSGILVDHLTGSSHLGYGVTSLAVLPNGHLVAAGQFNRAGETDVHSIAEWNGSAWVDVGGGVTFATGDDGFISSLAVLPSGTLVAGGGFDFASGTAVNSIAQWNGTTWSAMGNGLRVGTDPGECSALVVRPNGHLVASGYFNRAGNVIANSIARWNGSNWAAYGAGVTLAGGPGYAVSLAVQSNGDVIVGGTFDMAGTTPVSNLARYNGSAWFDYANGGTNADAWVDTVLVLPSGNVLVSGPTLTSVGGVSVEFGARWNGTTWQSLQLPDPGGYRAIIGTLSNEEIVGSDGAAGNLYHGMSAPYVDFHGCGFSGAPAALAPAPNGDVYAAGYYSFGGTLAANHIARWNGATWHALASELQGFVQDLVCLPNGNLVAAERVVQVSQPTINRVMMWNGTAWAQLGASFDLPVISLAITPTGEIVAGGFFTLAGSTPIQRLARWDGTAWQEVGGGTNGYVADIAVRANGNLIIGGEFTFAGTTAVSAIAEWTGSGWNTFNGGVSDANPFVGKVALRPNGDVVASGNFIQAGGVNVDNVALWNGASWSNMLGSLNFGHIYFDLLVMSNGDVLASGTFHTIFGDPVDHIGRWNGSDWEPLGTVDGDVSSLVLRANGDVVAAGSFYQADGQTAAHFAVFHCDGLTCDSIDFNNDGLFPDTADIDDFLAVFAGLPCPSTGSACNTDIDFNNDGLFPDTLDIDSFLSVFSGNACV